MSASEPESQSVIPPVVGRTVRSHDLTVFAEREIAEKITAMKGTIDALREENRRLKEAIAQYTDYQKVITLGRKIEALMWESEDERRDE